MPKRITAPERAGKESSQRRLSPIVVIIGIAALGLEAFPALSRFETTRIGSSPVIPASPDPINGVVAASSRTDAQPPPHKGPAREGTQAPAPPREGGGTGAASKAEGWLLVDYGALVDRRRLSHSGEAVGSLLSALQGHPMPPPGENREDAFSHLLLDPLLEPYAFVLPDALDAIAPAPDPPMVEIGDLWQPGEAQPAWAELVRARRYVVLSDGEGKLRLFLPWTGENAPSQADGSALPAPPSLEAARQAWDEAWPVLRHLLAAERRFLARRSSDRPEDHPLEVEVYPYAHFPARTTFHLGLDPLRIRVEQTQYSGARPALDLAAWQSFLDKGLQLEGARLDPDGNVRLIGSAPAQSSGGQGKPGLLGRPLALSDYAVAYRAIFQGGVGEPYMSLDRGNSPEMAVVNYGGRLQDTSLGLVSLLCDVRFKTFSQGIDVLEGRDVRAALRREIPAFRTHMERFAADARSQSVPTQQTRLWFYPDSVDLTLSPEGDVLILRRVRMSAASERLAEESFTGKKGDQDPPWTRATVTAINTDYDALARFFPELSDLDQVVRLLSLFTWLRQERDEGLLIPDLDALLALELPAEPTPRRFPQLLAYSAMPAGGAQGPVDVFNRHPVVEALERLLPPSGAPLSAARRTRRALAALDRRQADHAALAREMESIDMKSLDDGALDLLAYRAERLKMHQLVLATLPASERAGIDRRESAGETLRTISTGIGGLDLGMGRALAQAKRRGERVSFGGEPAAPSAGRTAATRAGEGSGIAAAGSARAGEDSGTASGTSARAPDPGGGPSRRSAGPEGARPGIAPGSPVARAGAGSAIPGEPRQDSPLLPATEVPDHGLRAVPAHGAGKPRAGAPPSGLREFKSGWMAAGVSSRGEPAGRWTVTAFLTDGPEPRLRRVYLNADGLAHLFDRTEAGGFLRYRMERTGARATARTVTSGPAGGIPLDSLGPAAKLLEEARSTASPALLPEGLATLEIVEGEAGGFPQPAGSANATPQPAGSASATPQPAGTAGATEDTPSVRLRLRGIAGKELEAPVPRAILQRLVLGKTVDLSPDRPLPGLSPAEKILAGQRRVMVLVPQRLQSPSGAEPGLVLPGEEDAATLARALLRWWADDAAGQQAPTVVVGTDSARSPERWQSLAALAGRAALLLPEDAFPGPARALRERIAAAWKPGEVVSSPPPAPGAALVVLASAEAPGPLGARLRRLARDPAMKGKLLVVWPLGGSVRPDLPSSLLAEGNLSGLALAEYAPVGLPRAVEAIGALRTALAAHSAREKRPEDLSVALLWYF